MSTTHRGECNGFDRVTFSKISTVEWHISMTGTVKWHLSTASKLMGYLSLAGIVT